MNLFNDEVRFEVTNRCNARCIMCPREKMTRAQGVMDLGLYKKLIDGIMSMGAKTISLENYGETFLDPYILERAEYAKNKGLRVFTISNGSLLTPQICDKVVALFDKIRISIYGVTKKTYELVHKGLKFEKTKAAIEQLFESRANLKTKIRIELYFLYLEENKHEKDEFLRLYEHRADLVSVWKPHNWIDGRDYRIMDDNKKSCGRPMTGPLQIQWNGLVVPCCYDYDSTMVLGDLTRQSIEEILTGEPYAKLRKAHIDGNFLGYSCNQCDQLNKRDDVLVYTSNAKEVSVGATNTSYFVLES